MMGIIHHFTGNKNTWSWDGVPLHDYGKERPGVTVQRFISRQDNSKNMELRYFEISPGKSTNFEKHNYEHTVLVLKGKGSVQLGKKIHHIDFGDSILIESNEVHRLIADSVEPLGFMCAVLDKELRFIVHGEQDLVMYDDIKGTIKSQKHWNSYTQLTVD